MDWSHICVLYGYQLLEQYGTDDFITGLANEFSFQIIPVLNVDGYIYSHTQDRLYRQPNGMLETSYHLAVRSFSKHTIWLSVLSPQPKPISIAIGTLVGLVQEPLAIPAVKHITDRVLFRLPNLLLFRRTSRNTVKLCSVTLVFFADIDFHVFIR